MREVCGDVVIKITEFTPDVTNEDIQDSRFKSTDELQDYVRDTVLANKHYVIPFYDFNDIYPEINQDWLDETASDAISEQTGWLHNGFACDIDENYKHIFEFIDCGLIEAFRSNITSDIVVEANKKSPNKYMPTIKFVTEDGKEHIINNDTAYS